MIRISFCVVLFWGGGCGWRDTLLMKMGSKSGYCLPFESAFHLSVCRGVHEHRWGKWRAFCVLYGCPRWEACRSKLCVSHALWTCSVGQRQYLGRRGSRCPSSCQSSAPACCNPFSPAPKDTGLSTGFWEASLLEAEPEPIVFIPVLLPPVTPLPLSCLSFLAICSWISLLRWASQGLPGQPSHSIANPVTLSGRQPVPCHDFFFHQVSPRCRKLSTSSPACVLSSIDQQGASQGGTCSVARPLPAEEGVAHHNKGTILGWLQLFQLIHSYDTSTLFLAQWACSNFNISYFSNYKGLNEQENRSHWKLSIVVLWQRKDSIRKLRFIKEKCILCYI